MKYRFRRSVYGTKKFYWSVKNGKMGDYWKNPTRGYGELQKIDPQLEFECTSYFSCFRI